MCLLFSTEMAVARPLGNKIDELLKCPVCLDTFREPRTLCCLHTFCTECLEGCRRLLRRDIECPVCKRVSNLPPTGVRGLPTDYRIEQIRDVFSEMQSVAVPMENSVAAASVSVEPSAVSRQCDVCKAQQRMATASRHCVQVEIALFIHAASSSRLLLDSYIVAL
jgi:RING-type zinc-finger